MTTHVRKDNVKKDLQLPLAFPCLEQRDFSNSCSDNIIPFIRKNPKYVFPYRICRDFEDSGDAA